MPEVRDTPTVLVMVVVMRLMRVIIIINRNSRNGNAMRDDLLT